VEQLELTQLPDQQPGTVYDGSVVIGSVELAVTLGVWELWVVVVAMPSG
jgi:hypothetical protein